MTRASIQPTSLTLPASPLPRVGDQVVWYSDSIKNSGLFLGYTLRKPKRSDMRSLPKVRTPRGFDTDLPSFDALRHADRTNVMGPNWTRLTPDSIRRPTEQESHRFDTLLAQRTAPGPQYIDLIGEIWHRGFEVFLVGGTVRDVLASQDTKDVDLVTTMPLNTLLPILHCMYGYIPNASDEDGFVRIGGSTSSGDPFIDIKLFCHSFPGTSQHLFGSEFRDDVLHRDFACNAIYYDPINKALFDPTTLGIADAEHKRLRIICDGTQKSFEQRAEIAIRFLKFCNRGFRPESITEQTLKTDYLPHLSVLRKVDLVRVVKRQIILKTTGKDAGTVLAEIREVMVEFGLDQLYQQTIAPHHADLLA